MPFSEEWLAARIRELPLTPVAAEDGTSTMTIRDTVARKFARDLQAANPQFDIERFLEACAFLSDQP